MANQSINPNLRFRQRARLRSAAAYVEDILQGNRVALSQAITLVESTRPAHQEIAQEIVEKCLPHAGNARRIGITGSPGVGKSTFIEALGKHITNLGKQIAILAIDPSSQISRGSILGDKTRMIELSSNERAFVRPSPAGTTLGGVARKTRETIILCEAAGFDTIIIETVGVGQSEIAVHSMVDCFLLLLLPGAGDELQGIKRGIVEMADLLCINKADGERVALAKRTGQEYRNALHLFPAKSSNWIPKVLSCSALQKEGVVELWASMDAYFEQIMGNGYLMHKRQQQSKYWLQETIDNALRDWFMQQPNVAAKLAAIEKDVLERKISSFKGADLLLQIALGNSQ